MSFLDDNKKCKKAFWYLLVFVLIFIAGSVIAFYNCYKLGLSMNALESKMGSQVDINNRIAKKYEDLKTDDSEKNSDELKNLKDEKDKYAKEIESLNDLIDKKDASFEIIEAYNAFFKHMNHVIEVHGGFSGWTEDEHQTGLELARKTGDDSFVETVDWAWNETSVDPTTRIIAVWKAIAQGIDNAILNN